MKKSTKHNAGNNSNYYSGCRSKCYTKLGILAMFLLVVFLLFTSCTNDISSVTSNNIMSYRTATESDLFLKKVQESFPHISSYIKVGTTEEGRDIMGLIVSSSPTSAAFGVKPSIRITSSIHGNEKISSEIVLRIIDYITKNYNEKDRITNLVNNNVILFVPIINVDGYIGGTRENSNGVDLNRDFVNYYVVTSYTNNLEEKTSLSNATETNMETSSTSSTYYFVSHTDLFTQRESRAIRDFFSDKFDISLSLHAGDTIVNTLFDFTSFCIPKDGNLIYELGRAYADAKNTDTGTIFSSFAKNRRYSEDGVIMGFWMYEAHGTLQDWSYLKTGCIDTTIEVSTDKKPELKSKVREIFDYNRDSIISYIEKAQKVKKANISPGVIF